MSKTETATATKQPMGSSLPAQCKQLVLAIQLEAAEHIAALNADLEKGATPFAITDFISESTAEWLADVNTQITSTAQRGLSPAVRLANVQKEIADHYAAFPQNSVPGSPEYVAWDVKTVQLTTKRANAQRAVDKENKTPAAETATA